MTANRNRYLTFDGIEFNVLDPGRLYDDALRVGSQDDFWGKANSFTTEIGQEPGTFWILLPRAVYLAAAKNDTHSVTWNDSGTLTRFSNLVMASAQCVQMDGDSLGAYLVELKDTRQRLKKAGGVVRHYNVSEAMPQCTYTALYRYDTSTLNAGSPWTWQEMFNDVWSLLPSGAAGTSPTLQWTPPHDPESWRFEGQSAWDAIGMILAACQSAIVCNPISGQLSVVALGDSQQGVDATLSTLDTLLDWKPAIDLARAHRPVTVRVVFRSRQRSASTVEEVDQLEPWKAIDTGTGLSGCESSRVVAVRSDLFDEKDETGATLNTAALTATAAAITTRVASRYNVAGEERRSEHPGIVTSITLGSEIHRICYRDFGDDDGCRTEFWQLRKWGDPTDAVLPPRRDSARMAVVKITQDAWQTSNGWAYMADCQVVRYFVANNTYSNNACETNVTIWHPVGYPDNHGPAVRALHTSTGRFPARFGKDDFAWAAYNAVSQRWELLAQYEDHWRFELIDRITKGGSGTAFLRLANPNTATWVTTGLIFVVYDSSEIGPFNPGDYGVAKRYGDSNRWEILFCQRPDIVMVKATGCLYPGGATTGLVMEYDIFLTKWVDTAQAITINDPGAWNCLIIGEQAFARPNPDGIYDLIGSHGLTRKGKVIGDIDCGQSGSVRLYSDITSDSCAATQSQCSVEACNTWGDTRKIHHDEEVVVYYAGTRAIQTNFERRWNIIPPYKPRWVRGSLAAKLCPGDEVAYVTGIGFFDGCPTVTVTGAINTFNSAGVAGDPVLLLLGEDDYWHLIKVRHHGGYFGYDFSADVNANCNLEMILYREQMAYMTCENFDEVGDDVQFHNEDVVTNWSFNHEEGNQSGSGNPIPGTCQISVAKKSVCVLHGPGPDSLTIISLTGHLVLQDVEWNESTMCADGTVRVIFPLCADNSDTVVLFCGDDCESGSGSQQSGGQ